MTIPVAPKIGALVLATTAFYTYVGQLVPQNEVQPPETITVSADILIMKSPNCWPDLKMNYGPGTSPSSKDLCPGSTIICMSLLMCSADML